MSGICLNQGGSSFHAVGPAIQKALLPNSVFDRGMTVPLEVNALAAMNYEQISRRCIPTVVVRCGMH